MRLLKAVAVHYKAIKNRGPSQTHVMMPVAIKELAIASIVFSAEITLVAS